MYLTYEEYTAMGGTLDETTFNELEFEAEALVNWYTFNRLKNDVQIPSEVKRLIKYLITLIQDENEGLSGSTGGSVTSGPVASQSNDGVSVSYAVLSAAERMQALKVQEESTIKKYLQGVMNEAGRKLLYRGLYPGE